MFLRGTNMNITLALGGGGTRGAAHVGVLRILEQEGFNIQAIAGTSAGSIIAALYAMGLTPDEIQQLLAEVDPAKLYGWPLADGPGLLGNSGIANWLFAHFGEMTFSELKLPIAIVAVDLDAHREVILREGRVVDAILGSIAIPGIFPPYTFDKHRLVDGGTLDPVPVRAARALAPKLPVVAVVLTPPLEAPADPWTVPIRVPLPIVRQFIQLRIAQAFGIFLDAAEIAQRSLTELRLELDKPDVIIRPDVMRFNFLEKVDVDEIILRGEDAASAALPLLKHINSWQGRFIRLIKLSIKNE
jgi:NTE family protein